MKVDVIGVRDGNWSRALEGLRYDVYHLPRYSELEARRTESEAHGLLISEGTKKLFLPFLLRSCGDLEASDSAPACDVVSPYGYPGLLFNDDALRAPDFVSERAFWALHDALRQIGACTAFLRMHPILSRVPESLSLPGLTVETTPTVSVDLTGSQSEIWARTRKGHQSTINKTKRLGYSARVVAFEDFRDDFIDIYEDTMARVDCSHWYLFSGSYFSGLAKLGRCLRLCIVEKGQEIAAASILFECNGIVQAHLGGTRSAFLQDSPFSLLLHHARLWAKARGNEVLHIGGGVGGSEDSLYRFKSGFSRQRHDLKTLRLVLDRRGYREMVEARAASLGVAPHLLSRSNFFPAYRATV